MIIRTNILKNHFEFFSDISEIAECSNGYNRKSLILFIENLSDYIDETGNLRRTMLTLYWNEITKEWGKPNEKHYSIQDIKHINKVPTMPIESSDDYNRRYAKLNKADYCDTNFPVFVPYLSYFFSTLVQTPTTCNRCKYNSWQSWISFKVNDENYPADSESVRSGYPEARNKRQRFEAFTAIETQLRAVDNDNFPMRLLNSKNDETVNILKLSQNWITNGNQ